jgi:hypothetical protein
MTIQRPDEVPSEHPEHIPPPQSDIVPVPDQELARPDIPSEQPPGSSPKNRTLRPHIRILRLWGLRKSDGEGSTLRKE